ncbi:hypothetical protein BRETT_000706 [Brettanomyces bruxellensis]|uniref:Uncharacterized protein n=1 Tax=Dekkera bruxellensis TaxID=5007 RepID=A0A871R527_DEKBR|nr:uncharacterized protein BRETT_000706 [Brettanomyces bruxellensis]QOU20989.1 hypothetical protein BRETT_000706 [Brettanomyces bruxellensis]
MLTKSHTGCRLLHDYYLLSVPPVTYFAIPKYRSNSYRFIATNLAKTTDDEVKKKEQEPVSSPTKIAENDLLPDIINLKKGPIVTSSEYFIESSRSSLFKGYSNEYHFLAIQDIVSDFEQRFKEELSSRLQYLRRKDLKSELLDFIERKKYASNQSDKRFSQKETDKFFQQLVQQLVGKKIITNQTMVKQYELERLLRILENHHSVIDTIIDMRRKRIAPSIYQNNKSKKSIFSCIRICYLNRHLKSNTQRAAMRNTFPVLVKFLGQMPSPLIYAIRPLDMRKLSAIFKSAIVDLKLELSADQLYKVKSYYDELISGRYGLNYDEFETYCALLNSNRIDNGGIVLPSLFRAIQCLLEIKIKLNHNYIGPILAILTNEDELDELLKFLGNCRCLNRDTLLPILSKKLEFRSEQKDVLSFAALLKSLDRFYTMRHISENGTMLSLFRSFLSCGFYSSAKRILTMLVTIGPDPLEDLDEEQLRLVKKLSTVSRHLNACILSNLKPTAAIFDAFLCYLCEFTNSWNQIKDIFELSYQSHVQLSEKTIWHLFMNATVSGDNIEELKQLMCDYAENYTSSPIIQKQEFIVLTGIFQKFGDQNFEKKLPYFDEGIPRVNMVKRLLAIYNTR